MAAPDNNNNNSTEHHLPHHRTHAHPSHAGVQFQQATAPPKQAFDIASSAPWPLHDQAAAQHPQFVVFELYAGQQQKAQQHFFSGDNRSSVLAATTTRGQGAKPFLPLGCNDQQQTDPESGGIGQQQLRDQSKCHQAQPVLSANGLRFATVQLETEFPALVRCGARQHRSGGDSCDRSGRGRLLFDNPMFRRLPNWHFFGDDRRLARVPPLIPLLHQMPVERTLLYIAPNESYARQLLLIAIRAENMARRRRSGTAALRAIEYDREDNVEAEEEHEGDSSEPARSAVEADEEDAACCCPSSTSGVESMSSASEEGGGCSSTAALTPLGGPSPAGTPAGGSTPERLRTPTPPPGGNVTACVESGEQPQNNNSLPCGEGQRFELLQLVAAARLPSLTTEDSSSCPSSTPNSPPTFDRRIVRMSRGTRNAAARRLSRRFEEEEAAEEEEALQSEANGRDLVR